MKLIGLLLAPFKAFAVNHGLIAALTQREIEGRYRGASLGVFWSLISPFLLLCIYAIAFGTVMGGRWPEQRASGTDFSIILFAGLIPYFVLSECMVRSPELVTGNPAYVKRVVFPLEILPWPMLLSALFHCLMNTLVFIALRLALDGRFDWTILYLPCVILPMAVVGLGMSWFLASISVYLRDVRQIIGLVSMALLFLSSVMIPMASVPPSYRTFFMLNPVSFIAEQARAVMLWGESPDWLGLGAYLIGALVFMYAGYAWFVSTKRGFADVI